MSLIGVFVVLGLSLRILVAYNLPAMANFVPLVAVAFVSSAFITSRLAWILPLIGLLLADIVLNCHHGFAPIAPWTAVSLACYALIACFGRRLNGPERSPSTVLKGTFISVLGFYLVSNSFAFVGNPLYPQSLAGWLQALSFGIPGYPPTLLFLRNSLLGNLGFTAIYLLAVAKLQGQRQQRFCMTARLP